MWHMPVCWLASCWVWVHSSPLLKWLCFNKNCELAAFRVGFRTARIGLGEDRCRDFPASQRTTLSNLCLSFIAAQVSLPGLFRGNHKGLEGVGTCRWALGPMVTWPRAPHTARKPTSSFLPCILTPLLITRFLRISLSGSNKST